MKEQSRSALYYKILADLEDLTSKDEYAGSLVNSFIGICETPDLVGGSVTRCHVDHEWIERIEALLPEVGTAISQMRSLIKNEGEVVRIDQAKRPSKETVIHLAKHSNLIKNVDDEGKPEPDELYITGNYDDFAVYENRFLYYLLTSLHGFVTEKYGRICEGVSKSGAVMNIGRDINTGKRIFRYSLSLSDLSDNGALPAGDSEREMTERIQQIIRSIEILLSHPLMKQVSSAPRLKPPIVRTNIIKNNPHFAAAFELCSYIASYRGDGFELIKEEIGDTPLTSGARLALARIAAVQSYIAFLSAHGDFEDIKEQYHASEREYINRELTAAKESISALKASFEAGETTEPQCTDKLGSLIASLDGVLSSAEERAKYLESGRVSDAERISALERQISAQNDVIRTREVKSGIEELRESYETIIRQICAEHEAKLNEAKAEWERERTCLTARLRSRAIIEGGEITDPDDRESFVELEKERDALNAYYRKQWKKTKARIRREVLHKKPDKKD